MPSATYHYFYLLLLDIAGKCKHNFHLYLAHLMLAGILDLQYSEHYVQRIIGSTQHTQDTFSVSSQYILFSAAVLQETQLYVLFRGNGALLRFVWLSTEIMKSFYTFWNKEREKVMADVARKRKILPQNVPVDASCYSMDTSNITPA